MTEVPVRAEMTASVWKIVSSVGDVVTENQELVVLESMKMEIPVVAPTAGTVLRVEVTEGESVQEGETILVIGT